MRKDIDPAVPDKNEFCSLYREAITAAGLDQAVYGKEPVIGRLYAVTAKLIGNAARFNLTSILDPSEIVRKHLIDSLLPLPILKEKGIAFKTLLDIGTGAGFPLLPMACVLEGEGVRLTGMDATAKKIAHIRETAEAAALTSVTAVAGRAEELAKGKMREAYDLVTARAVANLPVLTELAAAYIRTDGFFCAMKAHEDEDEITAAAAAAEYGLIYIEGISYELPGGDARRLVLFKKEKTTPLKYPRRYPEILKQYRKSI